MTKKNCPACGKGVAVDAKFCPSCGKPIGKGATKTPTMKRVYYHVFILAVLAMVMVAYIGYVSLVPDEAQTADAGATQGMQQGMTAAEMTGFIENLPTEFEPLVNMGNALMDQGQYDLARECYLRALELNPSSVDVQVDLGTCLHALGMADGAIEQFSQALANNPEHHVAKFNMGIVYLTLGDTTHAVAWWQQLLDGDPPVDLKSRAQTLIDRVTGTTN